MHDACAARGCHFFVLTNWTNWVFGAFTPGRSRAFLCATIEWHGAGPTVLEALLYWIASGMRDARAYTPPQVGPPDAHLLRTEYTACVRDMLPHHERAARALARLE
jgi:hypothetical protein